ncbi:MAG: hypothetical protein AB1523_08250 [Bacillota bacterium]
MRNKYNQEIHDQTAFCKRWDCRTCAPDRAAEELAHYLRVFHDLFPDPGLFYAEISMLPEDPRPRLRQRCAVKNSELLTVVNSSVLYCFSSADLTGSKAPYFRRLTWNEVVEKLVAALRVPGIRPHGISASAGWRRKDAPGTHRRLIFTSREAIRRAKERIFGLEDELDRDQYAEVLLAYIRAAEEELERERNKAARAAEQTEEVDFDNFL